MGVTNETYLYIFNEPKSYLRFENLKSESMKTVLKVRKTILIIIIYDDALIKPYRLSEIAFTFDIDWFCIQRN